MTSASEQTSASKRDERYITAPSGKRITESEWMNGGDPEWTDEFKQKTFDNFHRQEFASPQQQPDELSKAQERIDKLETALRAILRWMPSIDFAPIECRKDIQFAKDLQP